MIYFLTWGNLVVDVPSAITIFDMLRFFLLCCLCYHLIHVSFSWTLPTKATLYSLSGDFRGMLYHLHLTPYAGKATSNWFKDEAWPKVLGKWGIWEGKCWKAAARTAAKTGNFIGNAILLCYLWWLSSLLCIMLISKFEYFCSSIEPISLMPMKWTLIHMDESIVFLF